MTSAGPTPVPAIRVDKDQAPPWVLGILTENELSNSLHLQWISVVERVPKLILGRNATAVAHLAYRYCGGRSAARKGLTFFPSYETMAAQMKCSTGPVKAGVKELDQRGFVMKTTRRTADGHRMSSNLYALAWPLEKPCLEIPNWCHAPTRQGGTCQHPAGWHTDHEGEGLCKVHENDDTEVSP